MSEKQNTQGWDSITNLFRALYPGQENPYHLAPMVSWRMGGNDPLDGISVYDGGDYFHFVTYGLSELYEKISEDKEHSGYGFEMTVRLKKTPDIDEEELQCLAGVLQNLAQYIFYERTIFRPHEYIYTGQETGIDAKGKSKITGFGTVWDDKAGIIHTPNGDVEFIQLVGLTDKELKAIIDEKTSVLEVLRKLGHTLTDYERDDIVL